MRQMGLVFVAAKSPAAVEIFGSLSDMLMQLSDIAVWDK